MIPMRVALFTDSDVFAGTERHMLDLALGLREAGVDVRVACPNPGVLAERAAGAGLPVVAIEKRGLLDFAAIRKLAAMFKDGTIDVVHSHNGRTALLAAMAVKFAGKGHAVATQHFLEPAHLSRRGAKAFLSQAVHRWLSRATDRFIAVSNGVKAVMLERKNQKEDKVSVVHNGMPLADPARLTPAEKIRAELGFDADTKLIVCVARLEREKDLDVLIAAMKDVAAADPKAVCIIAGEGSQRPALLEQIAALGLEKSVKLIGFRKDALAVVQAADVFVLPSAREPFGLVFIEAMSVKKPIVAARAGGPLEIVANGETGLLVEPNGAREMGRALITLLADQTLREKMGAAGHARFLEKFTVERMVFATQEVYKKALAA
jgi:glycosyltransferase involved in cell wall biosynthesis